MNIAVQVFVLAGALLMFVSAIGTVRFSNAFARLHALTKAATLGVIFILIGAILNLQSVAAWSSLVLAIVLQLLTSSLSGSLLSRATYRAGLKEEGGDQQAAVSRLGEDPVDG